MKSLPAAALAILAILLLAAPASAASFDCAQAGTEIERMICGDEELSALDELLGDRYVRALRKGEDPKAIKTAQRAWLRDTRNACPDAACLKAAYEARIADLTKIGWMTDEKAHAICERISQAILDGSYEKPSGPPEPGEVIEIDSEPGMRVYAGGELALDYDSDGKIERLGWIPVEYRDVNNAVARGREIFDIAQGKPDPIIYQVADVYMTFGDLDPEEPPIVAPQKFLITEGEAVLSVIPLDDGDRSSNAFFNWLAPDGSRQDLCEMKIDYVYDLTTSKAKDPALCQAVAESSVEFLTWEPVEGEIWRNIPDIGDPASSMEKMSIDLDLDGEVDTIGHFGRLIVPRGQPVHDYRWLVELSPDLSAIEYTPLSRILIGYAHSPYGWRDWNASLQAGDDYWDMPQIFMTNGKPYVLGPGPYDQTASVTSMWGGIWKEWCAFESRSRPGKVTYSLTWKPAE